MNLITAIEVKSDKENFLKEISDIKNNTVRIVSVKEDIILKNIYYNIKYIKVDCDSKPLLSITTFLREISDITRYEQDNIIIYIFTWKV